MAIEWQLLIGSLLSYLLCLLRFIHCFCVLDQYAFALSAIVLFAVSFVVIFAVPSTVRVFDFFAGALLEL